MVSFIDRSSHDHPQDKVDSRKLLERMHPMGALHQFKLHLILCKIDKVQSPITCNGASLGFLKIYLKNFLVQFFVGEPDTF